MTPERDALADESMFSLVAGITFISLPPMLLQRDNAASRMTGRNALRIGRMTVLEENSRGILHRPVLQPPTVMF